MTRSAHSRAGTPGSGAAGRPAALIEAVRGLRTEADGTRYPLALPGAATARDDARRLVARLDDYLLPRLSRMEAPLLVVVGGSTGAGKSTLVNSLVGAPVSPAGVLRPTTRAPVLASHPADAAWFAQRSLLPGLARTASLHPGGTDLRLVAAPGMHPGLALLDAPDIDSVVSANRVLADQLLGAADLWLFVTTAARYADAVPWDLLRAARDRGAVVALVLDRVPGGAEDEVAAHLAEMLAAEDLSGAPLFVLPEVPLDGPGLLAERLVAPLRDWLTGLAADERARAAVVRRTVRGAVDAAARTAADLAGAAQAQDEEAAELREAVRQRYDLALAGVADAVSDGTLLRGEVLARWQEFVGTGEFMRALQTWIGGLRDRLVAGVRGRPAPVASLRDSLGTGLVALIRAAGAEAAQHIHTAWQARPAGAALLAGTPELYRPGPEFAAQAQDLVAQWQQGVLALVREQGARRRRAARLGSYAVNAGGLLVMIAIFSATAFIPTGLEVAVAGGTTVAGQRLLEAVFGDQAMRELARRSKDDLLARVEPLLAAQAAGFTGLLDQAAPAPAAAGRLRAAGALLAREAVALDAGPGRAEPDATARPGTTGGPATTGGPTGGQEAADSLVAGGAATAGGPATTAGAEAAGGPDRPGTAGTPDGTAPAVPAAGRGPVPAGGTAAAAREAGTSGVPLRPAVPPTGTAA